MSSYMRNLWCLYIDCTLSKLVTSVCEHFGEWSDLRTSVYTMNTQASFSLLTEMDISVSDTNTYNERRGENPLNHENSWGYGTFQASSNHSPHFAWGKRLSLRATTLPVLHSYSHEQGVLAIGNQLRRKCVNCKLEHIANGTSLMCISKQ